MPDSGFIGGTGPGTGTGTGTTPTVDPFLQSMIDEWGSLEMTPDSPWNKYFSGIFGETTATEYGNSLAVKGAMNFMENNSVFTQDQFNALMNQGDTYNNLMSLINPQIPDFLSSIFRGYEQSGEKALGNMTAPTAANMDAYNFASSSAGQYNKEGGINMPQEATDFQTQQAGKIQQFQQTQSTIDQALQSLEDPGTATAAMLVYSQNILGYLANQLGGDTTQFMAQLQANEANFAQWNDQMKQIFQGSLNMSYGLSDDIVKAITANSLTSTLLPDEIKKLQAIPPPQTGD